MKRRFTILTAALALLAFLAFPMGMRGQVTWTASEQGYENAQDVTTFIVDNIVSGEFAQASGTNAPKYYTSGTSVRMYNGNTLTLTPATNYQITRIEFTFNQNGGFTVSTGNYTDNIWTGTITTGVTFTNGSSQNRIQAITVTYSEAGGTQPTTYTVTYNANVAGVSPIVDTYNEGSNVTLRPATTFTHVGYTFSEWNTQSDGDGDPYDAGDVIENIQDNIELYAIWTENIGGGTTATLNIQDYATAHNWENATQYLTATVDPVTFTAAGGGNTGKYYTNGQEWRYYQGESASITISVPDGYTLVSVTPTYNSQNNGVLMNGNSTITSGSTVSVSGTSVTFTVGNSESATNGQVRFTNIDVAYVSDGGNQAISDLTITNQTTDLTFDLYNNSDAQVITYTTSSTGAITITPAESDYFTYVHDAQNKTITVTPTAVTPNTQTVTINQEADDDYYAGTATFTVSITDSAPLANIAALTAQTVASTYNVDLSNAVVTYVNGNYAYIQDASGAVVMYKNGHGLTAGDVLNGTATVTYQVRNGNPQITDLTGVTPVSGTAPDPTEVAASDWDYTFSNVLSQYFKVTGATITQSNNKYYVSLNDESIQLYKQGTAISNLDLTKTYSITGFPTMYNTTKELQIFDDPEVETSAEPSVTVTPATINAPAAGADGSLTLTYENIEEFISFDYNFCDANGGELQEDPDWIYAEIQEENENYTLYYLIDANEGEARTTYLKVYTFDDDLEEVYAIVTINQAEYVVDYAELPFEFDGGVNEIETTNGLTQENLGTDYNSSPKLKFEKGNKNDDGLYSILVLKFNECPGTLTYDIKGNSFSGGTFKVQTSEDGETYTDLATYTDLTSTVLNESFNNLDEDVRYIKWIYAEKVNGNVALGNIHLYEVGGGPVTETYDLTVEPFENLEIFTFIGDELSEPMEGAGTLQVQEGANVMLSVTANEGYILQSLMVDGVNHVNDIEEDLTYSFTMPGHNITISATAVEDVPFEPATYTLATSIESGKTYIIVGSKTFDEETHYFAMGEQRNNNRGGVAISIDGTTVTVETADVHEFIITALDEDGFYSIYDGGYLYAASSSGNQLKTEAELDVNGQWEISINDTTGWFNVVASNSTNRNVMQFNYNNDSPIFSCYASASQSPVYLYVKDETPSTITQTATLIGGAWNRFGLSIEVDDPVAMLDALKEQLGDAGVIIETANGSTENYGDNYWWGDIDDAGITNEEMILIEVSEDVDEITIELQGEPANPANHQINIVHEAWNRIGFPCSERVAIEDALTGFDAVDGDVIEGPNGQIEYYEGVGWWGDFEEFIPGEGYMFNAVNATEDRTLVFSTGAKKARNSKPVFGKSVITKPVSHNKAEAISFKCKSVEPNPIKK
jgi:hypothetical protein